jgi:type II secretory pathway pseudopilin PulG
MNQQAKMINPAGRQQGFVLILTLVLLAVMTLIAVSSMNSANVELKAASNARQHQFAFNAVQSLLEYAVSGEGVTILDFQDTKAVDQTLTATYPDAKNLTAVMNHAGCGPALGSSLSGNFKYNYFQVRGSGENKTGTASSVQAVGVRYPAAACDE